MVINPLAAIDAIRNTKLPLEIGAAFWWGASSLAAASAACLSHRLQQGGVLIPRPEVLGLLVVPLPENFAINANASREGVGAGCALCGAVAGYPGKKENFDHLEGMREYALRPESGARGRQTCDSPRILALRLRGNPIA